MSTDTSPPRRHITRCETSESDQPIDNYAKFAGMMALILGIHAAALGGIAVLFYLH